MSVQPCLRFVVFAFAFSVGLAAEWEVSESSTIEAERARPATSPSRPNNCRSAALDPLSKRYDDLVLERLMLQRRSFIRKDWQEQLTKKERKRKAELDNEIRSLRQYLRQHRFDDEMNSPGLAHDLLYHEKCYIF